MTGSINWKNGIDIYTLLYIKYITNKDLLYNTESSVMADMENWRGEIGNSDIFLGSKITMVTAAMKFKDICSLEGKLWQI